MPVSVTMLQTRRGEDGAQWSSGNVYTASDAFAAILISSNLATGTLPQPAPSGTTAAQAAAVAAWTAEPIADAASRNITAADNGLRLAPTVALTYTIPAGLSPKPSFSVNCPAAGAISVAVSGGATINGAGTTLTRTRAANPVGFVIQAHSEANSYGVSGA